MAEDDGGSLGLELRATGCRIRSPLRATWVAEPPAVHLGEGFRLLTDLAFPADDIPLKLEAGGVAELLRVE